MANLHPRRPELMAKIKKGEIKLDPLFSEIMSDCVGNSIYSIQMITGNYVTEEPEKDIPAKDGKRILAQCEDVIKLLAELREAIKESKKD